MTAFLMITVEYATLDNDHKNPDVVVVSLL